MEELERIVSRIRGKWKRARIIIRGDSGFCRKELMEGCEIRGIDYVPGMGRTSRLMKTVEKQARRAQADYLKTDVRKPRAKHPRNLRTMLE